MVEEMDKVWKKFLKNHFQMFVIWIVAAILAIMGAIRVFLWFVAEAQTTDLVPEILSGWAMNHLIGFALHLIFWELIFIGIPVLIFIAVIYFLWWKQLPEKERKEYKEGKLFGKRSRRTDGGQGISFLIFIAFIIKIYLDGNWSKPFATWEFDYLVYSWLTAFIWVIALIGIPLLIGVSWWINHELKK
jgi:hypothetical protein